MSETWYQKAIVYSLDIETFYDSDDDGIGDFQGLISKLGYIAGLGINCLWLLPFFPSPNHDNGYDVKDYYNIDPRLGTLGDFAAFMHIAAQYGIRVIIDLVVNHTSDRHPWFLEARRDKDSKYRDYYVWADKPLPFRKVDLMFSGEEDTVWSFDKKAGQYYLHRFYKQQPDLNIANPEVKDEIMKIMGFWLQMGVSGFRIDAAELLIEPYGMRPGEREKAATILEDMRAWISSVKSDAILIGETNIKPDKIRIFLDGKQKMHLLFNFYINQHMFLALADGSGAVLKKALKKLPPANANHWLNFLRHHDELSLKLLTKQQRERVYRAYAPEAHMRIYDKGIRRRLAPMFRGDQRMMKMMYSLMFSLPGIPLIRYGDEIGMGENLSLKGRNSVRTIMQWANAPHGGFSKAKKLQYPGVKGPYSSENVNVLSSLAQPDSFFNWIKMLVSLRKQCQEIINKPMELIDVKARNIMVHLYCDDDHLLLLMHNLSDEVTMVHRDELPHPHAQLIYLMSNETSQSEEEIILSAYGFVWLKILTA